MAPASVRTGRAAMLSPPLIQVAGVMDADEAKMLCDCGVPYLGFPLRLDVHEPDLDEAEAGRIIRALSAPHRGVVITYLDDAAEIATLCAATGARIVQLHGPIDARTLQALKSLDAGLAVIKSLVVGLQEEPELHRQIETLSPWVDAFITDTHDPDSGASGATGKRHDWAVSRRLVEASPRPVIIAGGLDADNVAEAIETVRPAGVDAHTGLEGPDGRKDRARVERFVRRAREALQAT